MRGGSRGSGVRGKGGRERDDRSMPVLHAGRPARPHGTIGFTTPLQGFGTLTPSHPLAGLHCFPPKERNKYKEKKEDE